MNFLTNSFVLALIAGLLAFGVTYVYLKKTINLDEDESPDTMTCVKVGGLTGLCSLLTLGYLSYANSINEEATLTTEFFQIGQPQF
jgi:hypothetical protein